MTHTPTYTWTEEGWLYVAVMLDLLTLRTLVWPIQYSMTSKLVAVSLMTAPWKRGRTKPLQDHFDHGSQYISLHLRAC